MTLLAQHGLMLGVGSSPPLPAFPVVLSITPSVTGSGSAATKNVAMPASVNAGDLLVILFRVRSGSAISTPAAWTAGLTGTNGGALIAIWYKVSDGTEGSTTIPIVTGGTVASAAHVYRIQAGTHQGVIAADIANSLNPPSLSPPWGSANNLWIAYCASNTSNLATGFPYANGNTTNTAGGGNATMCASCWDHVVAGTEDPAAFTVGASAPQSFTVAIRPA